MMPLKVLFPFASIGLELYLLGVHTRAKKILLRSVRAINKLGTNAIIKTHLFTCLGTKRSLFVSEV